DPSVKGLLADLADAYRILENEADRPSVDDVDKLYKAALELDISHVQTYFNAGAFYKSIDRVSESERCFARASRLDRSWGPAALALAEIYLNSDRPTDAVDVLDLAIRHGCIDPNVVWQAGLGAFRLQMWMRSISYFQLFRQLNSTQPFTQYYTALALCHLEKYQEAIDAIEIEVKINPGIAFAAHSIKCLSYARLSKKKAAESEIDICLNYSFASIQGLNVSGMSKAAERIRQAANLLGDEARSDKIVERAFKAGIVSNEFFSEQRALNKTREEVDLCLYEVSLNQELSKDWKDDINCPPWEVNWQSYRVNWLVLAPTQEQAEAMAMAYQKTCATIDAKCLSTERLDDKVLRGQEWGVVDHSPRDPKINA
ncbi:MAG: tetratricopeptide repeat protein, partial [Planctomycetota bacterium]|nr:tetratricopeptide repeat protein [Planctomycetota bacterium]